MDILEWSVLLLVLGAGAHNMIVFAALAGHAIFTLEVGDVGPVYTIMVHLGVSLLLKGLLDGLNIHVPKRR